MQHPSADNQVKAASQLLDALERQLMQFEVLKRVLLLQLARMTQTRLADIDGGHPGTGLAQRVACGLRRTATGNQNLLVTVWPLARPYPVEHGAATLRNAVQCAMFVEALQRWRIGQPFVERSDFFRDCRRGLLV